MSLLHELDIRHPYVNEVPPELMKGFEACHIDPEWQWVLVADGRVKAQLLACDAHGLFMILRLTALPDAPTSWLVRFLREIMKEARRAGCFGFITFLSDQNPQEIKLMRIVQRHGGYLLPQSGAWAAGSTEVTY